MDPVRAPIPFPLAAARRPRDPVLHPSPNTDRLGLLCLQAAAVDPALSAPVRAQAAVLHALLNQGPTAA